MNCVLSLLQLFHISRLPWRNPSMGCHGWIHNWRSTYSSGCACSAACTFPAPKAQKRFWTADECELQPQKVHGRGLVPSFPFSACSCRERPWLPYCYLSWDFITHSFGSWLNCSHSGISHYLVNCSVQSLGTYEQNPIQARFFSLLNVIWSVWHL